MPEPTQFNIEDVVALDPADTTQFTPEHKTFLEEHKDELTTDELIKFGFQAEPVKPGAPAPKEKDGGEGDEGGKGATAQVDPDDEATITRIVKKEVDPLKKENQELRNKIDIDSYLASNPDMSKYRKSIEEYRNHPAYTNIPVHEIAKIVAGNDLMKLGARKERVAAAKANNTHQPGNSARKSENSKDWGSVSRDDFLAKRAEVLGRR